jgi:hypothetical protein
VLTDYCHHTRADILISSEFYGTGLADPAEVKQQEQKVTQAAEVCARMSVSVLLSNRNHLSPFSLSLSRSLSLSLSLSPCAQQAPHTNNVTNNVNNVTNNVTNNVNNVTNNVTNVASNVTNNVTVINNNVNPPPPMGMPIMSQASPFALFQPQIFGQLPQTYAPQVTAPRPQPVFGFSVQF